MSRKTKEHRRRREFPDEIKEQVRKLADAGEPVTEIARKFDIFPSQVSQWKKQTKQRSFRFSDSLNQALDQLAGKRGDLTNFVQEALKAAISAKAADTSIKLHEQMMIRLGETTLSDAEVLNRADQTLTLSRLFSQFNKPLTGKAPKFLKNVAYEALLALWHHPKDFVDNCSRDRTVVKFEYPDDDVLAPLVAFQDEIFDWGSSFSKVGDLKGEGKTAFFDVALRADMALRPKLFAFGFYETKERRAHFGVIPYGAHEKFGIIFHEDSWQEFKKTIDSLLINDTLKTELLPEHVKLFFAKLVQYVSANGKYKTIYSQDGFIHEEIVGEIVYRNGVPQVADQFSKVSDKFVAAKTSLEEEVETKLNEGVVLYDLIYDKALKTIPNSKRLPVPHRLEIPVGIGFTLTAIPQMLENNEFETLRDQLRLYTSNSTRVKALKNAFAAIGVAFKEDLLK